MCFSVGHKAPIKKMFIISLGMNNCCVYLLVPHPYPGLASWHPGSLMVKRAPLLQQHRTLVQTEEKRRRRGKQIQRWINRENKISRGFFASPAVISVECVFLVIIKLAVKSGMQRLKESSSLCHPRLLSRQKLCKQLE